MVKQAKRSRRANHHGLERLESRELLTTLLEGLAANNLTGTSVAPLGNIFDDSTAAIVGDDFAISAPAARNGAGDVYVVFGGAHLNPQPPAQQGCITPPTRVQSCSLIDSYLTNRVAVRILGARPGDNFGYSVAGVGNVIGDSRPDLLVGAPFALNAGLVSSGRAYLIGGEVIAAAISAARAIGGTAIATIDLSQPISATTTIRIMDGLGAGDQAGNAVTGLGSGFFAVSAPKNGAAPKQERGAIYVFAPLRGVTGSAFLTPISTVLGPSFNAHLGGVPAEELAASGFRGYGVSGLRNPALIPVADEMPNDARYSLIGGFEPDVLVGAPDACFANNCTTVDAPRHGQVYLLSGTALITIGGTYDLSSDADLKAMNAIVVRGAADDDRLGSAVSSAGDLDGDGISDFMFSAPDRDIPGPTPQTGLNNAGEVYVVFGREVNPVEFPNGQCQVDPGRPSVFQQNFRQCRDANGLVVPLEAAGFIQTGTAVGLTLRGELPNERAGTALAEAGNFVDPLGRSALIEPAPVGVNEILIGSPFYNLTLPGGFVPQAGRAYVLFGTRDYRVISGQVRNLSLIDDTNTGQVIDGREANGHFGISVAAAGNAFDPIGTTGGDILIGANRIDVTLAGVVAPNVGEVEVFFGSTGGLGGGVFVVAPGPFIQPGTYGPQIFVGGYWSFTNTMPPAGSVVHFPLQPSQFNNDPLFPPATSPLVPAGSVGPFVAAFPLGAPLYLPDRPGETSVGQHKKLKKPKVVAADHDAVPQPKVRKKYKAVLASRLDALADLGAASQ